MAPTRVADALVDALVGAGVRRIYGVAGDSLNGVTDSLRSRSEIQWIHVRHEESAAFAAGAEAQLTGHLAACAGSCGPGNVHLVNGLYDAHRSRAPVLAIAAQVPSSEIGSGYFQETHPAELFRECSHYAELVSSPEQFPWVMETAMRTAIAREGVAVVVLPGDVALRPAVDLRPAAVPAPSPLVVRPDDGAIDALVATLNAASRVTILAGRGCAGARDELLAFAGRLQAPIVHALRGKEHVEWANPFDVGMTGLLGFASGYRAMETADVVVLLGTDFPYRQFYPSRARIVQVDLRGENLGRRAKIALGILGDVRTTLAIATPRLSPKTDNRHLATALDDYGKARKGLDELAVPGGPAGTVHPQFVARTLDQVASDDAIFCCDVGTPTIWAARYLSMNGRRRLLGSFVHGSMANALPQAIGAQAAQPGRQVITLSGDGGLSMLLGDLLTLRQHSLPVKVVVFRNDALAFVGLEMEAAGLLDFATDLVNPDFARIADAAGLLGISVSDAAGVRPALEQALAHPGPALVEVRVGRQELALPPSISWGEVRGFGLFLIKAVLSGRGDEVVDLARTNWFG
jgi:pyruvate dehydrogenase (quinone)